MTGFKPLQNRGKAHFYSHVETTMPSHLVLWRKVISTHVPCVTLLPVAKVAVTVAICFKSLLLTSCPWGAVFWYWSVWKVFISLSGYFCGCSFLPFCHTYLIRGIRNSLDLFNLDLSRRSGLMCLGGGPLFPSSLLSLSSEDMNSTALGRSSKAFILVCHQQKDAPSPTLRYDTSISEHQKKLIILVTVAWLLWKTLTITFSSTIV